LKPYSGANFDDFARAFDDTTEEFIQGQFRVPDNLDATGAVKYRVSAVAKTAAADKTVCHRIVSRARADGEDNDAAFAGSSVSGPLVIDADQDHISLHEWTQAVSATLWTAGDVVTFRYSRYPTLDSLVGDMLLLHLAIEIPIL